MAVLLKRRFIEFHSMNVRDSQARTEYSSKAINVNKRCLLNLYAISRVINLACTLKHAPALENADLTPISKFFGCRLL